MEITAALLFFGHWNKKKVNFVIPENIYFWKQLLPSTYNNLSKYRIKYIGFHCSFYKAEKRAYLDKSVGLTIRFLPLWKAQPQFSLEPYFLGEWSPNHAAYPLRETVHPFGLLALFLLSAEFSSYPCLPLPLPRKSQTFPFLTSFNSALDFRCQFNVCGWFI